MFLPGGKYCLASNNESYSLKNVADSGTLPKSLFLTMQKMLSMKTHQGERVTGTTHSLAFLVSCCLLKVSKEIFLGQVFSLYILFHFLVPFCNTTFCGDYRIRLS